MSRGNRSRVAAIVGMCLAAAVGSQLRSGFGSGPVRGHRARSAPGVGTRAKPQALAAHTTPAPPILTPEAAREARAAAIRETIAALREECQRAAGGDWDRWSAQLAPVQAELAGRVRAARPFNPTATGGFEARSAVLEGRAGFPLFESTPDHYLLHAYEPASMDVFRRERPVVAGARWLERRGIHLVFVPVPKMTEVYAEHFLDHVPPDGIIAPHMRRTLLELLEADVEVVDLLPALRRAREADADEGPLYQPADPHWAPRAQAIAARLVADRLARYDFVARAQASPPVCKWGPAPYTKASEGATFPALNPDQQRRAAGAQPRSQLVPQECTASLYEDSAPVICIGDSYNGGFLEQLGRELNVPVRNLSGGGQTTEAFRDFLRDPGLLADGKVVIWLVCNSTLKNPWPVPPKLREASGPAGRD